MIDQPVRDAPPLGPPRPPAAAAPDADGGLFAAPRWGLRGAVGLLVSLLALAAVAWWASKQEPPRFPTSAGALALIAVAVLVYGLATVVRGSRWHRILRQVAIPHSSADVHALVPVGYMGNTVLPARGGELLRVFLLAGRGGARRREVLGSIVSERMLDAAVLVLLFAVFSFAGVAGTPVGTAPAVAGIVVLVLALAAGHAYLVLRRRGRLEAFADRVRPLVRACRPLLARAGFALLAGTVLIWALEGLVLWLVGQSLSLDMSPVEAGFIAVMSAFLSLVPAAPGYVGTYDAAMVFGLHALGIAEGQALTFALLARFVVFVPITIVGLGLLVTRYGGLQSLKRSSA